MPVDDILILCFEKTISVEAMKLGELGRHDFGATGTGNEEGSGPDTDNGIIEGGVQNDRFFIWVCPCLTHGTYSIYLLNLSLLM